jgi:hypothetical protein
MSLASLLAITVVLFAVLHFWVVPAAYGRVIRPGAGFGQRRWAGTNAIGTVKRWVVFLIADLAW